MMNSLAYIGREFTPVARDGKIVNYKLRDPLHLDFSRKEHTFIVAKSGGGKSYLAGVYAEELVRTMENYAVVVLDPMGIFNTLTMPNTNEPEFAEWNAQLRGEIIPGGVEKVSVWVPAGDAGQFMDGTYNHEFSFRAVEFSQGSLCFAFDLDPLEPQVNLFRKARALALKRYGDDFTLGSLILIAREDGAELGFHSQTIEALITKLDALLELGIITNDGVTVNDVVRDHSVAVFDLSLSGTYTARIVVNFFAEKLLLIRRQITRMITQAKVTETTIEKPAWYVPPVQLVLDEAHNYLPRNPVLKRAIKEGRNCGFMMTAISQSPDLTRDVYANITHLFVGPLIYDDDISGVRSMLPVPWTPKEMRAKVHSLTTGTFLYFNIDEKKETAIRVRPRRTLHPASTELIDERLYFASSGGGGLIPFTPESKPSQSSQSIQSIDDFIRSRHEEEQSRPGQSFYKSFYATCYSMLGNGKTLSPKQLGVIERDQQKRREVK